MPVQPLESKFFLIFEKNKVLCVHMGGFFNNLEMQNHFKESIEFLEAKKLSKILVDLSKLEVLMNLSQKWLNETWYPDARNKGLHAIAFLLPIGFMTREDIDKINEKSVNKNILFRFFESSEKAESWLSEIN